MAHASDTTQHRQGGVLRLIGTVWRRTAGRRRPVPQPPEPVERPCNPLLRTATPLLALMLRLPGLPPPANVEGLRHRMIAALRRFQSAARAGGVEPDAMRAAHFILCAALDDLVTHTAWGRAAGWAERSLIRTFHKTLEPGPSLGTLLDHIQSDPERHLHELELVHVCVALGFRGRYRDRPAGDELQEFSEELYQAIESVRGPPQVALSPAWQGVAAPPPARARAPARVSLGLAMVLLSGLAVVAACAVDSSAGRVERRAGATVSDRQPGLTHVAPPPAPPLVSSSAPAAAPRPPSASPTLFLVIGQPPSPPAPAVASAPPTPAVALAMAPPGPLSPRALRLRAGLASEMAAALVEVLTERDRDIVRVRENGTFSRPAETLSKAGHQMAERLAALLDREPGRILVVGHTDDRFGESANFPSGFAFTEARARAIARVLVARLNQPERIDIEGRGDREPLVPNLDGASRERNRRVEIILFGPTSAGTAGSAGTSGSSGSTGGSDSGGEVRP